MVTTRTQRSAGGVVFRGRGLRLEVALISVGDKSRWQLPKGLIDSGESPEATAVREVREETGVNVELVAPIDQVEYWYFATERGERVRFHKFVDFYLLRYTSGDVSDHDREVNEARWMEIGEAQQALAFKSERQIVARAAELLASM
jgi:8-oxo-dGTP pyrophosphatase MutT (NUDIX family)